VQYISPLIFLCLARNISSHFLKLSLLILRFCSKFCYNGIRLKGLSETVDTPVRTPPVPSKIQMSKLPKTSQITLPLQVNLYII
jgi:hypothetical protein